MTVRHGGRRQILPFAGQLRRSAFRQLNRHTVKQAELAQEIPLPRFTDARGIKGHAAIRAFRQNIKHAGRLFKRMIILDQFFADNDRLVHGQLFIGVNAGLQRHSGCQRLEY